MYLTRGLEQVMFIPMKKLFTFVYVLNTWFRTGHVYTNEIVLYHCLCIEHVV